MPDGIMPALRMASIVAASYTGGMIIMPGPMPPIGIPAIPIPGIIIGPYPP